MCGEISPERSELRQQSLEGCRIRDRRGDETRRVGGVADATPGKAEARRGHGSAQSPSGDSSPCRFRGRALAHTPNIVLRNVEWRGGQRFGMIFAYHDILGGNDEGNQDCRTRFCVVRVFGVC